MDFILKILSYGVRDQTHVKVNAGNHCVDQHY